MQLATLVDPPPPRMPAVALTVDLLPTIVQLRMLGLEALTKIAPPPVGGPYTIDVDGPHHVRLDDVLVGVEAISIEGGDTLNRAGGEMATTPHVVGYQCAGTIIEVDTPGITAINPARFTYQRIRKGMYPLN